VTHSFSSNEERPHSKVSEGRKGNDPLTSLQEKGGEEFFSFLEEK